MTHGSAKHDEAWRVIFVIANTLKIYLQETIVEQYGCGKEQSLKDDIALLDQEIFTLIKHIEAIRKKQ